MTENTSQISLVSFIFDLDKNVEKCEIVFTTNVNYDGDKQSSWHDCKTICSTDPKYGTRKISILSETTIVPTPTDSSKLNIIMNITSWKVTYKSRKRTHPDSTAASTLESISDWSEYNIYEKIIVIIYTLLSAIISFLSIFVISLIY